MTFDELIARLQKERVDAPSIGGKRVAFVTEPNGPDLTIVCFEHKETEPIVYIDLDLEDRGA